MKKKLLILTLSFLVSTLLFAIISMLFGASIFNAFQKVTDGWIFGVLFMCSYDIFVRVFEGGKFTKTYIAMMALFLVNVATFSLASATPSKNVALSSLVISLVTGVGAIVLPFAVNCIQNRGNGDSTDGGEDSTDDVQKEWMKLRTKLLKMTKEKQKTTLQAELAFRLVGDSLYNSVDLTKPMIAVGDTAMTVNAGVREKVAQTLIDDANAYIDALIG